VRSEVIVVDDGSSEPVKIVDGDVEALRVLRHETPRGVAAARNTGIAAARGTWVAFLDDDDLWAPSKLRRVIDAAESAGAGFAYSGGLYVDALNHVLHVVAAPPAGQGLERALLAANVIPFTCSNVVARTELVRTLEGFDARFHHLADWDMALRLSQSAPAAAVPEPLVAYTLHGSNLQADESGLSADLALFEAKHGPARAALGVQLDEVAWLRWRLEARRLRGDRRGAARVYLALAARERKLGLLLRALMLRMAGKRAMRIGRAIRTAGRSQPKPPDWLSPHG
jgi:glycosyltransferase involved in cell wall biosynthesis